MQESLSIYCTHIAECPFWHDSTQRSLVLLIRGTALRICETTASQPINKGFHNSYSYSYCSAACLFSLGGKLEAEHDCCISRLLKFTSVAKASSVASRLRTVADWKGVDIIIWIIEYLGKRCEVFKLYSCSCCRNLVCIWCCIASKFTCFIKGSP